MSAFQDKTIQSLDGPPPADYPELQAAACDCDYWHSKHRFHCATNFSCRTPTSEPTQ